MRKHLYLLLTVLLLAVVVAGCAAPAAPAELARRLLDGDTFG